VIQNRPAKETYLVTKAQIAQDNFGFAQKKNKIILGSKCSDQTTAMLNHLTNPAALLTSKRAG
jgi:hypothetical protein